MTNQNKIAILDNKPVRELRFLAVEVGDADHAFQVRSRIASSRASGNDGAATPLSRSAATSASSTASFRSPATSASVSTSAYSLAAVVHVCGRGRGRRSAPLLEQVPRPCRPCV